LTDAAPGSKGIYVRAADTRHAPSEGLLSS
jgi:hypothetical protein